MTGKSNLFELLGLSRLDRQSRAAAAMQRWSDAVSEVVRSLDLDEDDPRLAALNDQSNGMVEAFEAMLDEQTAETGRRIEKFRAASLEEAERAASNFVDQGWRALDRHLRPMRILIVCGVAVLAAGGGFMAGLYVATPSTVDSRSPPRAPLMDRLLGPPVIATRPNGALDHSAH
jgi:hypothetical protein